MYKNAEAAARIKEPEKEIIIKTALDFMKEAQEKMIRKIQKQKERKMAKDEP
jgi:hypothetical protein